MSRFFLILGSLFGAGTFGFAMLAVWTDGDVSNKFTATSMLVFLLTVVFLVIGAILAEEGK